jgi:hypothetical protein
MAWAADYLAPRPVEGGVFHQDEGFFLVAEAGLGLFGDGG